VDQGVRDGFSVRLPDTGGQWAHQFKDPYLDVQVVASSPQIVTSRVREIDGRITQALTTLEDRSQVDPEDRIATLVSPPGDPPVAYEAGRGNKAALATVVIGCFITAGASSLARVTAIKLRRVTARRMQ
jgi:hypothetical protein